MWGAGRAGGLGKGRGCGRGSQEQLSGFLQRPPPPPQIPRTRKDCAPGQGWGELGSSLLLQDGGRPHSSPVFFLQPCMHLTSLGRPRLLALETSLPSLWVTREYRQVMTSQGAVCLLWAPECWGLQEEGSLALGLLACPPVPVSSLWHTCSGAATGRALPSTPLPGNLGLGAPVGFKGL